MPEHLTNVGCGNCHRADTKLGSLKGQSRPYVSSGR
jgi:hypothetical protein